VLLLRYIPNGGDNMNLREAMEPYIKALTDAIKYKNWHLALMPALTLPDICCSLEVDEQSGRKAYIKWIDTYSIGTNFKYTLYGIQNVRTRSEYLDSVKNSSLDKIEPYNGDLLNGVIVYALRCAFLHNGDANISEQDVHKDNSQRILGINKIKFISDPPKINQQFGENVLELVKIYEQIGDVVELDAKKFCKEILVCVENWIIAKENSPNVVERANKMIHFI
jgi:hypothetical protein